jgi:hypothetical protein
MLGEAHRGKEGESIGERAGTDPAQKKNRQGDEIREGTLLYGASSRLLAVERSQNDIRSTKYFFSSQRWPASIS